MFDIHSQFNNIGSIELCVDLKERQPSSNIFYPSTSSQLFPSQDTQPFHSQETQTFHDTFDPSSSQINTDQLPYSQIDTYQPSTYQHDIYQSSFEPPNIDINLDPTEEHHEDEVDDESEDEAFYDSEYEADEGEGDDEDEMTPTGEAYVPPSYMASVDLAYVDQYAEIGHIPTLPVDGDMEIGKQFHSKKDCTIAIRQYHIRERFNYTTTYKKAWIAKNKAIEQIYRNWEKSYQELPRWLIVLQTFLPNTVIQLETLQAVDSNGNILQNSGIFHRLFWACYPCIKGFAYCKPIVQVDGT
ncbi:hypothetical protein QL285_087518 [Trifolium repens]|nr:hypothetical protein QL285_087518 [Trifolium repens]